MTLRAAASFAPRRGATPCRAGLLAMLAVMLLPVRATATATAATTATTAAPAAAAGDEDPDHSADPHAAPVHATATATAATTATTAAPAAAAGDDDPDSRAAGHVAPAAPASAMPDMPYPQMASIMDMDDASRFGRIIVDQWEWRDDADRRASGVWDAEGWYGGDYDKLWLRTEGDWPSGQAAQGRAELLWDRIAT